jgi:sulfur carrier protein
MNATAELIEVTVNGARRPLPHPATLHAAVVALGLPGLRGVAAAVNGEVVPRPAWESRTLAPGDQVLVIRATQGG